MAGADYRRCDVCGGKTFYDASLSWEDPDDAHPSPWLSGLGDWAVICEDCAKTYEVVIQTRAPQSEP